RTVWVVFQVVRPSLVGGDRARARPKWRLVRRQLEYLGRPRRAALAGYVGVNIEHAGPRLWPRATHYLVHLKTRIVLLPKGKGGRRSRCTRLLALNGAGTGFIAGSYSGSRDCRRGPRSG